MNYGISMVFHREMMRYQWRYPKNWMVYFMENPIVRNGWWLGVPFSNEIRKPPTDWYPCDKTETRRSQFGMVTWGRKMGPQMDFDVITDPQSSLAKWWLWSEKKCDLPGIYPKSIAGVDKCLNWTSPNYWGHNLQQIWEGDVQNPQKGTFTNPCIVSYLIYAVLY